MPLLRNEVYTICGARVTRTCQSGLPTRAPPARSRCCSAAAVAVASLPGAPCAAPRHRPATNRSQQCDILICMTQVTTMVITDDNKGEEH